MGTTGALQSKTTWAVIGSDGKIVVIFSGDDAPEAAQGWRDRGYLVLLGDN